MTASKTYFVIDDDLDDQKFLIEALTENEPTVKCDTAINGKDAINYLKTAGSSLPDVIFLDQNMPGLSGKQCLIELKKMPAHNHIPIIVYSTSNDVKERQQVMALGAFYFLVKNFSYQKLKEELNVIMEALQKRSDAADLSDCTESDPSFSHSALIIQV